MAGSHVFQGLLHFWWVMGVLNTIVNIWPLTNGVWRFWLSHCDCHCVLTQDVERLCWFSHWWQRYEHMSFPRAITARFTCHWQYAMPHTCIANTWNVHKFGSLNKQTGSETSCMSWETRSGSATVSTRWEQDLRPRSERWVCPSSESHYQGCDCHLNTTSRCSARHCEASLSRYICRT